MSAPLPEREADRLAALREYQILDTPPEEAFDQITRLAAYICGTPISAVSLIDADRQWFKSRHGIEKTQTPRDVAFCAHAILQPDVLIVPDALADARFAASPLVTEDNIRFYAGVPLITPDGHALGALCVKDRHPRVLSAEQVDALRTLARQTMVQLTLKRNLSELDRAVNESRRIEQQLRDNQERFHIATRATNDAVWDWDLATNALWWNDNFKTMFGYRAEEIEPGIESWSARLHPDDRERVVHGIHQVIDTGEQKWSDEYRFRCGDGSYVHIFDRGYVVYDDHGKPVRMIGAMMDITSRKLAEERLAKSEKHLRTIIDSEPECIELLSADGALLEINPAGLAAIEADSSQQVLNRSVYPFVAPEYRQAVEALVGGVFEGQSGKVECEIVGLRGTRRWVDVHMVPFRNTQDQIVAAMAISRDITERKRTEAHLNHLANHDALTSLPNRTLLYDRLGQALIRIRWRQRLVAVLFVDLDHFKQINDTLGHSTGDLLLKAVSERLSRCVRGGDTVARLGGDEFVIVLDDVADAQDVSPIAQKILGAFVTPIQIDGRELFMTPSIGISVYPNDGEDPETLLKNADIAMYRAKEQGRNTYQHFSPTMNARSFERLALATSLRHALEREQFVVHYQPQVDLATGRITGMEALVRWHHPDWGLVAPGKFIPLAEETGLILPIGEWVLKTACAQNKAWQQAGHPPLRVAVNISARQFKRQDLVATVGRVLAATGLGAQHLELELTEGLIMDNAEYTIATLSELHRMGVWLSIDDFGVGYSSLSYLKRFPVHSLKIDQSFVRDLTTDEGNAAIVRAILTLARSLKLSVVAEAVETIEQLRFLQALSCDQVQGYLFSPPVSAQEATELLAQDKRLALFPDGSLDDSRSLPNGLDPAA